ncbi:MAG: pyrophosphatase [Pseudomonadota bacterium]|jgi:NTP pyrophosphatase (non-canonical NTP hydrolase)|nr:pyrophosphatase [Pseudomonadota bacterium]
MSEGTPASWLHKFANLAAKTDRFAGKDDHAALLAAGLIGEAGSVIAELKKARREREAYPVYRQRTIEEVGDFLWYFVRLADVVAPGVLDELQGAGVGSPPVAAGPTLAEHLELGASVGEILATITSPTVGDVRLRFRRTWSLLNAISGDIGISLSDAADRNTAKTRSRWPDERRYAPLFDDDFRVEEQIPRRLRLEFLERSRGSQRAVILRCNDINLGDRLTDNIEDADGYRFHDIFHFAYAVHLGWSPVVRALMRTKRKRDPKIDEAQDGARAGVIEEAVSAIVFSRAKQLKFFEGLDHVDFDLLKTVGEFVEGFEVAAVPLWQWETAILDGYRVFRALCAGPGGCVTLDLSARQLTYLPHAACDDKQGPFSTSREAP